MARNILVSERMPPAPPQSLHGFSKVNANSPRASLLDSDELKLVWPLRGIIAMPGCRFESLRAKRSNLVINSGNGYKTLHLTCPRATSNEIGLPLKAISE